MLVKTSELTDDALDWMVAKCKGITPIAVKKKYSKGYILYSLPASTVPLEYSSKWVQGGPIIECEFIEFGVSRTDPIRYAAKIYVNDKRIIAHGSTHLIAAMRCYVASKFGDTVEIPDQLL
jgi:hypothetical protein